MSQYYPGMQPANQPGGGAPDPRLNQIVSEMQRFAQQVQGNFGMLSGVLRRLESRVAAMEVRAALAEGGRKPRGDVKFRGQFGEDLFAWAMFDGQLDGFYIEVGAFDGKSFSVSSIFDVIGWEGLLVEAIPERYEQCKVNRPNARVVHSALGKPGAGNQATFTVTDDQFGGMLSYMQSNSDHARAITNAKLPTKSVTVPLTTMDALLEGHTGPIDLAVIDVEGGEAELLSGFDLKKYKPRMMLVEDNSRGKDKSLDGPMKDAGYEQCGWIEVSRIYIHSSEEKLLKRARGQE